MDEKYCLFDCGHTDELDNYVMIASNDETKVYYLCNRKCQMVEVELCESICNFKFPTIEIEKTALDNSSVVFNNILWNRI